ncbi:hypothetical protein IKL45_02635 [Candidatus Saccharibacteria bacterium]|nr:hypothetical protein [Candidatus Saccharibacteria bacterium]MBR6122053.1 hypothetical protein [Candidatus Saccharibacteria bacterium]
MVKSKNIIAGLGVVAGLGMALMPLGAFAAPDTNHPGWQETGSYAVRAHVGEVIEIAVTNITNPISGLANHSRVDITPGGTVNATTEHTVQVKSNARGGYQLLLKADHSDLQLITEYNADKSAKTLDPSINIPGLESASDLSADVSGWGYKIKTSGGQYSGNFLPVPDEYDSTEGATIATGSYKTGGEGSAYHTDAAEYTDTYVVGYGIKAATTQPSGSYEAKVTYKAVAHVLGED